MHASVECRLYHVCVASAYAIFHPCPSYLILPNCRYGDIDLCKRICLQDDECVALTWYEGPVPITSLPYLGQRCVTLSSEGQGFAVVESGLSVSYRRAPV